jgi:hypothetical protein
VAELEKQLAAALARIEDLETQLASAKKNSSGSCSGDVANPFLNHVLRSAASPGILSFEG